MGKRAYHSGIFTERFNGGNHVAEINEWLNALPGEIVGVAVDVHSDLSAIIRQTLEVHVVTEEKGSVSIGSEP